MSGSSVGRLIEQQSGQMGGAKPSAGNATASSPTNGAPAPQPRFQQSAPTQQLPQSGLSALGSYSRTPMPQMSQGGGFFGANIQAVDNAGNYNFALPAAGQSAVPTQQAVGVSQPSVSPLAAYMQQNPVSGVGNRWMPNYNMSTGRNGVSS